MDFVIQSLSWWSQRASGAGVALLLIRLTLIGAFAHLALAMARRAPASLRHFIATTALAAMLAVSAAFVIGPSWPSLPLTVRALPSFAQSAGRAPGGPGTMNSKRVAVPPAAADRVPASNDAAAAPEPVGWNDAIRTHAVGAGVLAHARVSPPIPWIPLVVILAFAAAAGIALVRGVAALAMAGIASAAERVEDKRVLGVLARAALHLGFGGDLALRSTAGVAVPLVTGLARPVLLLPAEALEWDESRLLPVFLHELAHIRRGDGVALLITRAATAVAWFHPLTWSLARIAARECERACDDVVLGAGVRASAYAGELLAIARSASGRDSLPDHSLALARPGQLEGRLLAILNEDVRRGPVSKRAMTGAAALGLVMLVSLTSVRVVAAPSEPAASRWNDEVLVEAPPTRPVTESSKSTITGKRTSEATAYELANSRSRSADEWFSEARDHYDAEDYDAAGEFYERAARAGHREPTAWYNAACSYALAGRTIRALGALQSALDAGFDDLDTIQSDEDLDSIRADRRYQMMVSQLQNTDEMQTRRSLARVRFQALRGTNSRDSGQLRSVGVELMRSGEPGMAAEAFAREYAVDSLGSSLYNMACAQAIGGETAEAMATLESSIYAGYGDGDKLTSDPDLGSLRGRNDFGRLVELADDLSLEYGGWFDGRSARQWQRDIERYQRIAAEHPQAGRAWFNLGLVQLRAQELPDSRRSYLKALDLGYRRGATMYNLACTAAQMRELDEALRWLDRSYALGFEVANSAGGDEDLKPLRFDRRFLERMDRWRDESWDEKHRKSKQKS